MEQLPPKAPNMTQNWASSFPLQMMPIPSIPMGSAAAAPPSWVDEFLDFSFAKRNAHRRFVSDSISFLPLLEDCPTSSPPTTAAVIGGNTGGFERLDDEQLMSMFADEMAIRVAPTVSSSNPSTPSDQNSDGEKPTPTATPPPPLPPQDRQRRRKEEPREGDGSCKSDASPTKPSDVTAAASDSIIDPKRVKRILANRQSAQRSRVRKLQYISELERSVTTLQTKVSALSPRVAFLDYQRLILNVDNSAIKQRIAALHQDKIFKDAHQEALKKEIERLRQVYQVQKLKKMAPAATTTATATATATADGPPPPQPKSENFGCTDKDNSQERERERERGREISSSSDFC